MWDRLTTSVSPTRRLTALLLSVSETVTVWPSDVGLMTLTCSVHSLTGLAHGGVVEKHGSSVWVDRSTEPVAIARNSWRSGLPLGYPSMPESRRSGGLVGGGIGRNSADSVTPSVCPTPSVTVLRLSASVTLTSPRTGGGLLAELDTGGEVVGGAASLAQLMARAGPVPASCMPKVAEAPGASLPFHGTLTAVTVPLLDVVTVAFHPLTIRRLLGSAQVTDQTVAVFSAVLTTLTLTTSPPVGPLPHWFSTCAVAWQLSVAVAAAAMPVASCAINSTVRVPAAAVKPDTASAARLDIAIANYSSRYDVHLCLHASATRILRDHRCAPCVQTFITGTRD